MGMCSFGIKFVNLFWKHETWKHLCLHFESLHSMFPIVVTCFSPCFYANDKRKSKSKDMGEGEGNEKRKVKEFDFLRFIFQLYLFSNNYNTIIRIRNSITLLLKFTNCIGFYESAYTMRKLIQLVFPTLCLSNVQYVMFIYRSLAYAHSQSQVQ